MKYFEYSEFDSPGIIGSGKVNMDTEFLSKLDYARGLANTSFIIVSGYRTLEHNKIIGGVRDSSHLKGLAADIKCNGSRQRAIMIQSLIKAGFTRIGIGKTFIHVDDDKDKDQDVFWLY